MDVGDRVIIAFDFDLTWTRDPEGFRLVVELLRGRGHTCICVTGRSDEGNFGAEVKRGIGGAVPIVFAGGAWKATAAARAGYPVDGWVDDMPEGIREQTTLLVDFKRKMTGGSDG